jgi:hypothetical protein
MAVSNDASREIVEMLQTQQPVALDEDIRARRGTIDRQMERTDRLRVDLTQSLSVLRSQQDLLDVALTARNDSSYPQRLLQGWESLRSHPRLADASVRPSTSDPEGERSLFLTTTTDLRLHRSDTGESRWLGAFEIEMTFASGVIKMRNLNTRRGGRDHPHVVDQHPCFGQHADAFAQLMATGDLIVLYELLVQYIETLNLEDDWGRYGAYWFDVEDEQPESQLDAGDRNGATVEAVAA